MDTTELQALKKLIRDTITQALFDVANDRSIFPTYTTKQVARIYHVSPWTVRSWHKQGLIEGRYQVLSGRTCRLIFSNRAIVDFFYQHFPLPEDFTMEPNDPRSTEAARIQRMLAVTKLYARRRRRYHG